MKAALMPYLASILASDTLLSLRQKLGALRRRLSGKPPTLIIYIKPDDPYSYLLLQVIPEIQRRFNVRVHYRVFTETDSAMFPRPDLWQQHSIRDAQLLAQLYDLEFPDRPHFPSLSSARAAAFDLVAETPDDSFVELALVTLAKLWGTGAVPDNGSRSDARKQALRKQLSDNAKALHRQGHYLGAMIYFEGVWYWGIDRLDHLERRLNAMGLNQQTPEIKYQRTWQPYCQTKPAAQTSSAAITLYWSARSPYSYIGLERAVRLAKHYGLKLHIKPVLPMVMRGMAVPHNKKMYIFLDTKREAKKLGLAYGRVADPVGPAVERCYALLDYARNEGKLIDFLLSFARGVNCQGIRAETDRGLQHIVSRCGLNWNTASALLDQSHWQAEAAKNLEDLLALGFWGVPTIGFDGHYVWGQDRLVFIEQLILKKSTRATQP